MTNKETRSAFSIYIPKTVRGEKPVERLNRLGKKKDRAINYLIVEAILQYLDREEKRKG